VTPRFLPSWLTHIGDLHCLLCPVFPFFSFSPCFPRLFPHPPPFFPRAHPQSLMCHAYRWTFFVFFFCPCFFSDKQQECTFFFLFTPHPQVWGRDRFFGKFFFFCCIPQFFFFFPFFVFSHFLIFIWVSAHPTLFSNKKDFPLFARQCPLFCGDDRVSAVVFFFTPLSFFQGLFYPS